MKKIIKVISSFVLIATLILPLTTISEKNKTYAEGTRVYNVPIALWHAENTGRLSMGARALGPSARVIEYANGTSTIYVNFVPMDFMNMHGHLYRMSVYSSPIFNGSLTRSGVSASYRDTNLDGNQDTFPGTLYFNYSQQKADKIGIRVSVDAMDKIMGGDASQNAILKFNWASASLVSDTLSSSSSSQNVSNSNSSESSNASGDKKDENNKTDDKNATENKEKKQDPDKAPEGFKFKKLEDYFKEDTHTKEAGVYSIDITAAYLNPLTGITADGGTRNAAIGEGMTQGVISPVNNAGTLTDALANQKTSKEKRWSKAQLQRLKNGKLYATVRIHLMNWVKRSKEQGPFIKVLQENGEFKLVEAKESKVNIEQYKDSYVDYQFEVPHENFLAMIQMFVEPMNRPVRYFVEVNTDTIKKDDSLDMVKIEEKSKLPIYLGGAGFLACILVAGYVVYNRKKVLKKDLAEEQTENNSNEEKES